MNNARSRLLFLVAALSLLGLPDPAAAQKGFWDWISKLSGPEIHSSGVSWDFCPTDKGCPESRFRVSDPQNAWLIRGAISHSYWTSHTPEGSSGDIDLFQVSPTAVYTRKPLELELGVSFHRFSGEGFDGFWRHAFVAGVGYLVDLPGEQWYFQIGPRLRYFPDSFVAQDFGGDPEPEDSGGEWAWGGQLAFGYRF